MSAFGQPARTATSDANAGLVNTPAKKSSARTGQATSVKAGDNTLEGVSQLGSSLGNSLSKMLSDKAENINAQRQLDASIRQGNDKAINAIDKEKKRSGWEEMIFGQNVEYRGAQQRAIQNNVQQSFLEQANRISEFAAENEEQYSARLKASLDSQLAEFEGDVETQRLITDSWSRASEKLVQAQTKEHYAFKQNQHREGVKNTVRGSFDTITTLSNLATTEDEVNEIVQDTSKIFSLEHIPQGMTKDAYKSVIQEELIYSLEQGNIGIFNAANSFGWMDNISPQQRKQIETAKSAYDTKSGHGISLTVSEARLGISSANNVEEVGAVLASAIDQITQHEQRTSGTDRYANNIAKAKLALQSAANNALTGSSKKQVKQDRLDAIVAGQNEANLGDGTSLSSLGHVTPKEQKEAAEVRFVDQVGTLTGNPDISYEDAIRETMGNPHTVGSSVVQQWKNDQFSAGFVQTMAQSYVNGFSSPIMSDENGQPTQVAQNAMQLFAQFETADRAKFRKAIGEDAYDEYALIRDGQGTGKTEQMINNEIAEMREAKGNKDNWAIDWSEVTGKDNKREWMTKKLTAMMGEQPTGPMLGRAMEVYGTGLLLGKGDHARANERLNDYIKNSGSVYKGRIIQNTDAIDSQLEEYRLVDVLEGMDNLNLTTGVITLGNGKSEDSEGNPIRRFEQIGGVDVQVAHDGGVWIKSAQLQNDVYLSPEWLKTTEQKMIQDRNAKIQEAEIKQQSKDKAQLEALDLFDGINLKSF